MKDDFWKNGQFKRFKAFMDQGTHAHISIVGSGKDIADFKGAVGWEYEDLTFNGPTEIVINSVPASFIYLDRYQIMQDKPSVEDTFFLDEASS